MATQLQNGKQQFLDSNGDPLVGGKVYFYIPSTSTPKDTWTDQDETTLNTNPVILDSNGQAVIWGSGAYRQVLTDSADVTIWDQEVVDAVSAVATGLTITNSNIPDGEIDFAKLEDVAADTVLGRLSTPGAVGELPVGDDGGEFVRWDDTRSLLFAEADAATPSIGFDGAPGTGIYGLFPNAVAFTWAGTAGFRIGQHFGRGDWSAVGGGNGVGDNPMFRVTDINTIQQASSDDTNIFARKGSDGAIMTYRREDVTVGSVVVTATDTTYNTTSDHRLKENVEDIGDCVSRLMHLNPCEFNFIGSERRVTGFIAHELQGVLPNAVTGEKDGEEMQSVDHSKVVPLLTAALKEATLKIIELETRLNKLEDK